MKVEHKRLLKADYKLDANSIGLLVVNLITIGYGVWNNFNPIGFAWLFVVQSFVYIIFHVIRLLKLKNFTKDSMKIDGKIVSPRKIANIETAVMVSIPYVGLLLFIFFILVGMTDFSLVSGSWLGLSAIAYVVSGIIYTWNVVEKDKIVVQSLTKHLLYPFARLFATYTIVIIAILINWYTGIVVLIVKTIIDVWLYQLEENVKLVNLGGYVDEKKLRKGTIREKMKPKKLDKI